MEKLTIKKWVDETSRCGVGGVILTRGSKSLDISFQGNLDLYFSLTNFGDDATFIIGKDNYQVYELFDTLYNDVINGNVFEPMSEKDIDYLIEECEWFETDYHEALKKKLKYEEERRDEFKEEAKYLGLVKDNKIKWCSDDYSLDIAPFVVIEKLDNIFKLTFGKPKVERELDYLESFGLCRNDILSIRFRNSGTYYSSFNMCFMKLYNALMELDYENHQIHLEEYLIDKEIDKGIKLERILR